MPATASAPDVRRPRGRRRPSRAESRRRRSSGGFGRGAAGAGLGRRIALGSISYAEAGDGHASPASAPRGRLVRAYVDGRLAEEATVDADGRWSLALDDVAAGLYTLRIDQLAPDGRVASRVETPFQRDFPRAPLPRPRRRRAVRSPCRPAGRSRCSPATTSGLWRDCTMVPVCSTPRSTPPTSDLIRDPDMIYPGQIFAMPEVAGIGRGFRRRAAADRVAEALDHDPRDLPRERLADDPPRHPLPLARGRAGPAPARGRGDGRAPRSPSSRPWRRRGSSRPPSTALAPEAGAAQATGFLLAAGPVALTVAYGVMRLAGAGFTQLRDAVFARVGQRALRRLALETFEHVHALSLRYHIGRRTGSLNRVIDRGVKGVDFLLRYLLFSIFPMVLELLLVAGILCFVFDVWYLVVVVVTIVLYVAFTFAVTEYRLKLREEMNERDTEANQKAIDSLLNFETVKYFSADSREAARFDASMAGYESAAVKIGVSLAWLNAGQAVIITLGLVAVMAMAAVGVQGGGADRRRLRHGQRLHDPDHAAARLPRVGLPRHPPEHRRHGGDVRPARAAGGDRRPARRAAPRRHRGPDRLPRRLLRLRPRAADPRAASTSPSRPGRRWPSSVRRARGSRRSGGSSSASTT